MLEDASLADLKEKLILLGVSTSTPGLRGRERFDELQRRLDSAQRGEPVNVSQQQQQKSATTTASSQKVELAAQAPQPLVLPSVSRSNSRPNSLQSSPLRAVSSDGEDVNTIKPLVMGMTSSQLRENLILLGESTSTDGLLGEERRQELIKRLMTALAHPSVPANFAQGMRRRIAEDALEEDGVAAKLSAKEPEKETVAVPRRLEPIEPSSSDLGATARAHAVPALAAAEPPASAVLRPIERPVSSSTKRLNPINPATSDGSASSIQVSTSENGAAPSATHDVKQAGPAPAAAVAAVTDGGDISDHDEDIFDKESAPTVKKNSGSSNIFDSENNFSTPTLGSMASIGSFNFSRMGSMMSDTFEENRDMFQQGDDDEEDFNDHGLFDPNDDDDDEMRWLEGVATNEMTEAQRAVFVDGIRKERQNIKELLLEARRFESAGNLDEAEARYASALQINQHDVYTLQRYATFMHMKRMNVEQAALYYKKAVKECVPSLIAELKAKKISSSLSFMRQNSSFSGLDTPKHKKSSVSTADITKLLIHYGRFLVSAQGNHDYADAVFKKAVEISPNDSVALATYAHFLSSSTNHFPPPPKEAHDGGGAEPTFDSVLGEGPSVPKEVPAPVVKPDYFNLAPSFQRPMRGSSSSMSRQDEAEELFRQSIKAEPTNALHLLWYARLLKNLGKYPQADIMFAACVKLCVGKFASLEPTAYCNYATFVVKHRRDRAKADELFRVAVAKYPNHKQLMKNYNYFVNKGRGSRRSKSGAKRPPPQVSPQLREQLSRGPSFAKEIRVPIPEGPTRSRVAIGDDFRGVLSLKRLSCSDIIQEELGPPGGVDNLARARIGGLIVLGPDDIDVVMSVSVSPGNRSFDETSLSYDPRERHFISKNMTPSSDDITLAVHALESSEGAGGPVDAQTWGANTNFGASMIGVSISTVVSVAIHQIDKRSGHKVLLSYVNLSVLDILSSKEVGDYVYSVERAFASEQVEKKQILDEFVANTLRLSGKVTLLVRLDRLEKPSEDLEDGPSTPSVDAGPSEAALVNN